jgi:ParB family chromosome partitioning protein
MTIQHINLTDLTPAALNVRKTGAKEVADLIHSIRAIGLLQPLLVRETSDGFEVVAGQRRYHALVALTEETDLEPVPCMVMTAGDDAAAVEASLAENIARLPMDEVDQYRAFAKLVSGGKSVEDIAFSFGITDRLVRQRLALGNLHGPILTAYRKGDLDAGTLRSLTLATKTQQKAWWALVKDEEAYAPMGRALKDWLFGGAQIPTANALFDAEAAGLAVVSDLFGENAYFADSEAFWLLQNVAIAEAVEACRAEGWAEVIVMERGAYWASWDHVATSREEDGKVFITCSSQGEVKIEEGYLTQAEARRNAKGGAGDTDKPERPETTKAMDNYLQLHRHAAVRADLLSRPNNALCLIAAHMIAGSSLWTVEADPQRAAKEEIADSLEANKAQQAFEAERGEIASLLMLDDPASLMTNRGTYAPSPQLADIYATLTGLTQNDVLRILTFLMANSLEAGSEMVESLASAFQTDMQAPWSIDETFFDLLRDKEAINGMVAEIAGETAAKENITATAKTQKAIIKTCLDGSRPVKIEGWMPRYMAVPQAGYTTRNSFVVTVEDEAAPLAIAAE